MIYSLTSWLLLLSVFSANILICSAQKSIEWGTWDTWGQQSDGTYRNPIIPSDYSDLDCIRVGEDYYAISSTMHFSPGMTILHSRDLVNWEIVGNAISDLTQISPALGWQKMDRNGRGVWAGTIRYNKGRFYIFFGTPDEGYFMTSASKAEGPWNPLICLLNEKGWDDCSVIWDKKGKAWFVGTCFAEGYKTYIFPMAKDAQSIDRTQGKLVNEGNGREANKLIYHEGYYYLVFSEHKNGVGRYVMAKRDKEMAGNFEEEKQLLLACAEAHEPNQGGIVEGKDGKWYFLTHHGNGDWCGRLVSLIPVTWKEGWPMMGVTHNMNPGSMVWSALMPTTKEEKLKIQRTDEFEGRKLGPQWQWLYQPRTDKFSLTECPGWLRMYAFKPLEEDCLLKAGNTLTQRTFRTQHNEVTIRIDISNMADGQHAGLCHFAEHSGCLGVVREEGKSYVEFRLDDRSERGPQLGGSLLWLRSEWGLNGDSRFSYSMDGFHFIPWNGYQLSWGFYRGDRIGIYNYNNQKEEGFIDVDYLRYQMK